MGEVLPRARQPHNREDRDEGIRANDTVDDPHKIASRKSTRRRRSDEQPRWIAWCREELVHEALL
jgi:hypothetical protein